MTTEATLASEPIRPATRRTAYWREVVAMTVLGLPIVATQLAQMAIGTTDVIMIGRLGAEPLAAAALAVNFFYFLMMPMFGLMQAISPIAAHAIGADPHGLDPALRSPFTTLDLRLTLRMGLWAAAIVSVPLLTAYAFTQDALLFIGQDPKLASVAESYVYAMMAGVPFLLGFGVLRAFTSAMGRPRPALIVVVIQLVFNAVANYALVFGHFGFPQLGVVGSGLASSAANMLAFVLLAVIALREREIVTLDPLKQFFSANWGRFREIFRLGTPIGITLMFEGGVFGGAVALMGLLGTDQIAGHQIAINVASLTFMVPFGLAMAATVRVGYAAGARDMGAARRAGHVAMAMALAFMGLMGMLMWFAPHFIAGLYVDLHDPANAAAIGFAVKFLAFAALFQIFDGLQVAGAASLRGLKDTRWPMIIAGVAYWVIAFPLAIFLGFEAGYEGEGIWAGLAMGLLVAAVLMVWRFEALTRRRMT